MVLSVWKSVRWADFHRQVPRVYWADEEPLPLVYAKGFSLCGRSECTLTEWHVEHTEHSFSGFDFLIFPYRMNMSPCPRPKQLQTQTSWCLMEPNGRKICEEMTTTVVCKNRTQPSQTYSIGWTFLLLPCEGISGVFYCFLFLFCICTSLEDGPLYVILRYTDRRFR